MTTANPTVQRGLLAVLIGLLVAIGTVLVTRGGRPAGPAHTVQLRGPALPAGLRAANFTLTDQNGRPVTLSNYRGHVVVLTFIHSRCHDACPFMVEQIKGALNDLPGTGRGVVSIGVSVAPAEDTPANRAAFLAQHEMTGRLEFVNGPPAALRAVWKSYSVAPDRRSVLHTAFVFLVDKRGIERVGFPGDGQLTPEDLAHDIAALQRERA